MTVGCMALLPPEQDEAHCEAQVPSFEAATTSAPLEHCEAHCEAQVDSVDAATTSALFEHWEAHCEAQVPSFEAATTSAVLSEQVEEHWLAHEPSSTVLEASTTSGPARAPRGQHEPGSLDAEAATISAVGAGVQVPPVQEPQSPPIRV